MFGFAGFRSPLANALVAPFFLLPSALFVIRIMELDRRLLRDDLTRAMGWILTRYYGGVQLVTGSPPVEGPALLVGNHPGLGDLPATVVAIGRDDVVPVAKRRELMSDMEGVLDRCILIDERLSSRARALREIINRLREGGIVVIYPAGDIERDPAVFGGEEFLHPWLPFADGVANRLVREGISVPIVPVYCEGVHVVPRSLRRLLRPPATPQAAEGRAALITMMLRVSRSRSIRLAFGPTLQPAEASGSVTERVQQELRRLERTVRQHRTVAGEHLRALDESRSSHQTVASTPSRPRPTTLQPVVSERT